jgi:hypothetical protein
MHLPSRTAMASLALLFPTLTLALTPVAIIPASENSSCAVYPGWNASTNTAGPFIVTADSTGSSIDGNPATVADFTNDGKDSYGFVRIVFFYRSIQS